jgi:hypothetical protein
LNSRAFFQSFLSSREQTCTNCETQNPHSRLNCGRISVPQVAQETQRGLPTRISSFFLLQFYHKKCMRIKSRAFLFAETTLHQ